MDIRFNSNEILTPVIAVRDVEAAARLRSGRLSVEPARLDIGGGHVYAKAVLDFSPPPFEVNLKAKIQRVHLSKLDDHAAAVKARKGILDGKLAVHVTGGSKAQMAKAAQTGPLPYIKSLTIDGSQLSYLIPDANTRVNFSADTVMINEQRQITIEGDGRWQGEDSSLACEAILC